MDETYPMEPYEEDGNGIADYREQSRVFMGRARGFLAVSDLHPSIRKGLGCSSVDGQGRCRNLRLEL